MSKNKKATNRKRKWPSWTIPAIVLVCSLALFILFSGDIVRFLISTFYRKIIHPISYNENTTAAIGNTLNGTLGLVIAFIASYLTFLAFWVQYSANERLKFDLEIERFENKFYQMLQIHRDNVSEIRISKTVTGRRAFSRMFAEFKYLYLWIVNFYETNGQNYKETSDEERYNIAYLVFFYGCGLNSDEAVIDVIGEEHLSSYSEISSNLETIKETVRKKLRKAKGAKLPNIVNKNGAEYELSISYVPFQGHMGNLSHYIRHIFQLVKYVDEHYPYKDDFNKKSSYVASLRSQLSLYEQLFIYYNALSVLGQPWLETENDSENLLQKYSVIKSLPKPLANFYKHPDKVFGSIEKNANDIALFEWTNIKERFSKLNITE